MKFVIFWCLSLLPILATPDWANNTNENYLGSNEKFYATFLTETDNQGSHYEWREVKKLNEYSKQDGTVINSTIISDILYSIDANHNNPNTQPKITKFVQSHNKNILLSTVLTNFHLPLTPPEKPDWINRLSWKDGNILLDEKLTLVSKNNLSGLKIPLKLLMKAPLEESIIRVYTDAESIYLLFKVETDSDYNTHVLHISAEITKQLRDRISMLDEYVFLKAFKSLKEANAFGLEIIKSSQAKNFYGLNPEIWLSKKDEVTEYIVLHRPLELPIDQIQIKRLDAAIGLVSSTLKSDHFIEKWIPYDPSLNQAIPDDALKDDLEPEDLLKKPLE